MNLRLNLKSQWYEMIESGFKKEEYREIKPYWLKRLTSCSRVNQDDYQIICNQIITNSKYFELYFKEYDTVTFVYGYTKRQMTFKCNGIDINTGNTSWGAEYGTKYFVIKIGERMY